MDSNFLSPEGPYACDVYIGFAKENEGIAFKIRQLFQERKLSCFLRATNDDDVPTSILDGVAKSQRCFLLVTADYLKDKWHDVEIKEVLRKPGSLDLVVILKIKEDQEVPENLQIFKEILITPEMLNDVNFVDHIVQKSKEPVLSRMKIGDYGISSAINYYVGYLCHVLPDFRKTLVEQTLKNDEDLMSKTVQRMLIIFPESCFLPPKIISPGKIEFNNEYVLCFRHVAGSMNRDYKSSMYKLIGPNKEEYNFVSELPTSMRTMYDVQQRSDLFGMTKDQMFREKEAFISALEAILRNAGCSDQYKLLYWCNPETGKPNSQELYDLLLEEIPKELQSQKKRKITELDPSDFPLSLEPPSILKVNVPGGDPARRYDNFESYRMEAKPRGICLVVNIINFNDSNTFPTRTGSERDTGVLERLFKKLHFDVKVHIDATLQKLEEILEKAQSVDHSGYHAFVCCILSHGKLGAIYTSDGGTVPILKLVNYFTNNSCPTLTSKPKMFFIQACQGVESSSSAQAQQPSNLATGNVHVQVSSDDISEKGPEKHSNNVNEMDLQAEARPAQELSTLDPANQGHRAVLVPGDPDFLMSYSTLPGSLSYRDTAMGCQYITALNECIGKHQDLETELKQVSKSVRVKLGNTTLFQLPFHLTSGMEKRIYL